VADDVLACWLILAPEMCSYFGTAVYRGWRNRKSSRL
jgi:hypothetical protein